MTPKGEETDDGEPHVVRELRERLLRIGFIKIDRKGFLRPDAYAAADQIDRVEGDSVHLSVTDRVCCESCESAGARLCAAPSRLLIGSPANGHRISALLRSN